MLAGQWRCCSGHGASSAHPTPGSKAPSVPHTHSSMFQEELDSTDTSVVISSCSLAEARLLLDNFLKASIDKVRGPIGTQMCDGISDSWRGEQGARVGAWWWGPEALS